MQTLELPQVSKVENITPSAHTNITVDNEHKPKKTKLSLFERIRNQKKSLTSVKSSDTLKVDGKSVRSRSSIASSNSGGREYSSWETGQKFRDHSRPHWPNLIDAVLPMAAFACGISNLSNFPLVMYHNGGYAFLVPYFTFLIVCAYPLICMELLMGQYVQAGCISVWKLVPIFKGVGYSSAIILWLFITYYNTILAWSLIYFGESFESKIPFSKCGNLWNTDECIVPLFENYNAQENLTLRPTAAKEYFRGRILRLRITNYSDADLISETNASKLPHNYGFHTKLGNPNIDTSLCSFLVFFVFFVIIFFGINVSRRLIWFTFTIPYIILTVLFFRGITLAGGTDAVETLMKPDFSKLGNIKTWTNAALQVIFSTGAGFGCHLTHGSHNVFKQNIFRDGIVVCFADVFTSIVSAIIVYSYMGDLATIQNREVEKVFKQYDSGLAIIFEMFPDSLSKLSGGRFFVVIFYLMLISTGLDTGLVVLQTIATSFVDEFKTWFPKGITIDNIVIFAVTSHAFVLSIMCATRGGVWVYLFMDTFSIEIAFFVTTFIEVIAITWIWGIDDLTNAAEAMTGRRPGLYLRICWKFILPVILMFEIYVIIKSFSKIVLEYDGESVPQSSLQLGMVVVAFPMSLIPCYAFSQLCSFRPKSFSMKLKLLFSPVNEHNGIIKGRYISKRFTLAHFLSIGGLKCSTMKKKKNKKVTPGDLSIVITNDVTTAAKNKWLDKVKNKTPATEPLVQIEETQVPKKAPEKKATKEPKKTEETTKPKTEPPKIQVEVNPPPEIQVPEKEKKVSLDGSQKRKNHPSGGGNESGGHKSMPIDKPEEVQIVDGDEPKQPGNIEAVKSKGESKIKSKGESERKKSSLDKGRKSVIDDVENKQHVDEGFSAKFSNHSISKGKSTHKKKK